MTEETHHESPIIYFTDLFSVKQLPTWVAFAVLMNSLLFSAPFFIQRVFK